MSDKGRPRDLERVGKELKSILSRLGIGVGLSLAKIADEWDAIAPEPFGGRSKPVALEEGLLVIEVPDGITATLLRYRTDDVLRALEASLGKGAVTEVKLRVARHKKAP